MPRPGRVEATTSLPRRAGEGRNGPLDRRSRAAPNCPSPSSPRTTARLFDGRGKPPKLQELEKARSRVPRQHSAGSPVRASSADAGTVRRDPSFCREQRICKSKATPGEMWRRHKGSGEHLTEVLGAKQSWDMHMSLWFKTRTVRLSCARASQCDPPLCPPISHYHYLSVPAGLLFQGVRTLLPKGLQKDAFERIHASHLGTETCKRKAGAISNRAQTSGAAEGAVPLAARAEPRGRAHVSSTREPAPQNRRHAFIFLGWENVCASHRLGLRARLGQAAVHDTPGPLPGRAYLALPTSAGSEGVRPEMLSQVPWHPGALRPFRGAAGCPGSQQTPNRTLEQGFLFKNCSIIFLQAESQRESQELAPAKGTSSAQRFGQTHSSPLPPA